MSKSSRVKWAFRALLLGACLFLAGMVMFDPGSQVKRKYPEREEVIFWHMWTGEWKAIVERIVNEFNRSQQRYEVTPLSLPGGDANTKFLLSVAGGRPPDVMAQWNCVIPAWASRSVLMPLDSFMTPAELEEFRKSCFPVIWKIGAYKGRFYGLCAGLNSFGLYYRPSHFREAGLDPNRPPRTVGELDEMAAKLYKLDANKKVMRVGFLPSQFHYWMASAGGGLFDDLTQKLTIETPANERLLKWLQGYRERYGLNNILRFESSFKSGSGGDLDWPFITGAYSIVHDGQWRVQQIANFAPKLDYMTCPLPAFDEGGRERAGYSNGNFMIIPRGARCAKGGWEFMKFWSGLADPQTAAKFYTWGGWMPIKQAIVDTPDFQAYLAKHPQMRTFVGNLPSPNLQVAPPVFFQNFLIERTMQMSDRVQRLSETPSQALKRLQTDIDNEQKRLEATKR